MYQCTFLTLQLIIIGIVKGSTCGNATQYSKELLHKTCGVDTTMKDRTGRRRAAPDKRYEHCIRAYGFVAVLDNPSMPELTCVGAIISPRWVLDNCIESPRFQYQRIKIGVMMNPQNIREYRIQHTIVHPKYKRVSFTKIEHYTRYLFAATNALYLRKTANSMIFSSGTCAIHLHKSKITPEYGAYAVYMNQTGMLSLVRKIQPSICCDVYFNDFFPPGQQLCLTEQQFCVSTKRVTPDECCHSQAFMVHSHKLLGVMAWSTACSETEGVDPWVFSHIGYYILWISEYTEYES